ncbi:MAG: hypothetical protein IPG97_02405 [Microthrixaceae bacterium]|jgi:hypothetical protein|nr:hypothetical protein [Microthrixaceae bacterium]
MGEDGDTRALPVVRGDLVTAPMGGHVLVHNPATGNIHAINAAAGIVLEACRQRVDRADLIAAISQAGGPTAPQVQADLDTALAMFHRCGMLASQPVASQPVAPQADAPQTAASQTAASQTAASQTAASQTAASAPEPLAPGDGPTESDTSPPRSPSPGRPTIVEASGHAHSGLHSIQVEVLNQMVEIRCDDASILARASSILADLAPTDRNLPQSGYEPEVGTTAGNGVDTPSPVRTWVMEVDQESGRSGTVRISGPPWGARTWAGVDAFLDELPTVLNVVTPFAADMLVLHAGALRHPDGGVVVVAGDSGAGKSTLTAALVQAGWGYITDEAVGIRPGDLSVVAFHKPLALAPEARRLLGLGPGGAHTPPRELNLQGALNPTSAGDVVRAVILPCRCPEPTPRLTPIDHPVDAVLAIAPHSLNLKTDGPTALGVLGQLATEVSVARFDHPGIEAGAASALAALID